MAEKSDDVEMEEERILYDLTVQAEWRQEPEPILRYGKDKVVVRGFRAQSSAWSLLRTFGSAVGSSGCAVGLPDELVKLVSSQINWKFALSKNGELLAILQENCFEIRTFQNEFTTVRGKWNLTCRDSFPQWRSLAWSEDGLLLAFSDSSGEIYIYDSAGTELCKIPSKRTTSTPDLSQSICSLIFKDLKSVNMADNQHWFKELLCVNYNGSLTAYLISQEGDYRLSHTFAFSDQYVNGVISVVYHQKHSMLLIGGSSTSRTSEEEASGALYHGISAWRVLSDFPYYKLVSDHDADGVNSGINRPLVKKFKSHWFSWLREIPSDGVFKQSLSPDGLILATIHFSGMLNLWDVPSLRLRCSWPLDRQPDFDAVNQEIADNPKLKKHMKEQFRAFHLLDIGWWSNKAMILARGNGSVVVSSVHSLNNLLGSSPEWFEPAPIVTWSSEGCFLGLECETRHSLPNHQNVQEPSGVSQQEEEEYGDSDSDDDSKSVGLKASRYLKLGLYYVTDSEKFQPPRKKQKLMTRTYRLVCLKSTTPEELYSRKIDNEEYGEALTLAKSYQLDCDLVYQRQWRKSPVSVASIQDYLSKIVKRSWVLHECLERVPEDFDAMHELLKYGLLGTDLEAMVMIGRKEDRGRFILCRTDCDVYLSLDVSRDDSLAADGEASELVERKRKEWLNEIDFDNLTLEQQELCRTRLKLLQYCDRLMTYQAVLGGFHVSSEKYDHKFFEKFRSENMVKLAVEYARAGDASALSYLFTYHGSETLPHRLIVLSNFPETMNLDDYSDLLPETSLGGDLEVSHWSQESWRQPDWVEKLVPPSTFIKSSDDNFVDGLYEEQPRYELFRNSKLTEQNLTNWYELRAHEIESLSGLVDNALQLVKLGLKNGVRGLDDLLDDLETLETLIYECHLDESLMLKHLKEMKAIERLKLMMSRSSEEMYLKNVQKWVVPFLSKHDQKSPGSAYVLLKEYLVGMAAYDLTLCGLMFKACKTGDVAEPIISNEYQSMSLALDCIYAYSGNDQLSKAFEILECLPQNARDGQTDDEAELQGAVAELKNHLEVTEILCRNGLPHSVSFVRDARGDEKEATKLFTRIARTATRQEPPVSEQKLKTLLLDLCRMRDKAFKRVTRSTCYEIFVESLLCSGCIRHIKTAGGMMECSKTQQQVANEQAGVSEHVVPYGRSVELVLSAASEYFDSSASLYDADMELAKTCLDLVADRNPLIEEERDRIEAIGMLDGFCVKILPVQVRMCSDRLELVQKAMAAQPSAYRHSQKLLKLGKLLRVGGGSEVNTHGQVLRLVADAALKNNDCKLSYEACVQLMEIGFSEAWRECKNLAAVDEFHDTKAKSELLSFAMIHCSTDMIEPILLARNLLQIQLLYEQIHSRMGDQRSQSPEATQAFHGGALLAQTRDILHSTNKATRSVLTHVSDSQWWKKTLRRLNLSKHPADDVDDLNAGFQKQGCHPFYESVFDNCYLNRNEADYSGTGIPRTDLPGLGNSECVLRTAKLEEEVTEAETSHLDEQVLLRLAEDVVVQDSLIGLAYLVSLPPDATDAADGCFGRVPGSKTSLQLAIYYYALQIIVHLKTSNRSDVQDFYLHQPQFLSQKLFGYVTKVIEKKKESDWPENVQQMVLKMMHFHQVLLDYNQARTLENLDRGVDVSRFVRDESYKRQTILGMVLCLDDEVFTIAVSLATRHKIPLADIYMAHLEFLFEENSLSTGDIENRVQALAIVPELTRNGQWFVDRMQTNVYPLIDGKDHDRLLLFFSLVSPSSTAAAATAGASALTPQMHVKLLRKIKGMVPGLNYKHLTDGSCDPLDVIKPVIDQDNVDAMARLASGLNSVEGKPLSSSCVYRLWAGRLFWEGHLTSGKKTSDNPLSDWLHRYERCYDSIQKMNSDDFVRFVKDVVFSSEAVSRLPVDCRRQLLRRALKHSKQQSAGKKQKNPSERGHLLSWDDVTSQIQKFLEHIDRLNCQFLEELRNSSDPTIQNYSTLFDLTCSDPSKFEDLLVLMVVDGQVPESVEQMRAVADGRGCFQISTIVQKALDYITTAMKDPDVRLEFLSGRDLRRTVEQIVLKTAKHENAGGHLVGLKDIVSILLPFCADSRVAVEVRLDILHILKEALDPASDDQLNVLFYQTRAKVSAIGVDVEATEAVKCDEGRQALFERLLSVSKGVRQLIVIKELLLDVWPELQSARESSENPASNVWCQLIEKFLTTDYCGESIQQILCLVSSVCDRESFSAACLTDVTDRLMRCEPVQPVVVAKCFLYSRHSHLHRNAVNILQQPTTRDLSDDDEELFGLLLKRHQVTNVVAAAFYPRLVEYILCNQQTESSQTPDHINVEAVARELEAAGYRAEAGTMMMNFRSTQRSFRTFDAAVSILSRLFQSR